MLVGLPIEMVTGLLSYAAYDPRLSGNDPNSAHGVLGAYLFDWVTVPVWAYQVVEGVHIVVGLAMVPFVLAKLWSVMPSLFAWPPFRSVAQLLERATLLMLVGGILFQMTTGILDIDYVSSFGFYAGHFYGAWIFFSALVAHVGLRMGRVRANLGHGRLRSGLRVDLAHTAPEQQAAGLTAPTISRRGALAMLAGSSLFVALTTGGEIFGQSGRLAPFSTRNSSPGSGPNHFPVNHTAGSVGVTAQAVGPDWRLEVVGHRRLLLSRPDLMSMRDVEERLPLTCTEGWSTVQRWSGVRLSTLASAVGYAGPVQARLDTIDHNSVVLSASQVRAPESMLALQVNGADLSLDHGYPARIIVPSAPGTHNKKWMLRITFGVNV